MARVCLCCSPGAVAKGSRAADSAAMWIGGSLINGDKTSVSKQLGRQNGKPRFKKKVVASRRRRRRNQMRQPSKQTESPRKQGNRKTAKGEMEWGEGRMRIAGSPEVE